MARRIGGSDKFMILQDKYVKLYGQTQLLMSQADILADEVNSKYYIMKQNPNRINEYEYKDLLKKYNELKRVIEKNRGRLATLERRCLVEKNRMSY